MSERDDAHVDEMSDVALIERICAGDDAAKGELIGRHAPLVRAMAGRIAREHAQRAELEQAGYVGLLLAVRQYDAGQGARFVTYAVPWVLGEMRRTRARMNDAMGASERRRRIAACAEAFAGREGRSPRVDELAAMCGMSAYDVAGALAAGNVSLDARDEDGGSIGETVAGRDGIDVEALDLRMALCRLPEEERRLVILRYFRGRTQTEAAAAMGKSQTQVSRIERRALDRLRGMLA